MNNVKDEEAKVNTAWLALLGYLEAINDITGVPTDYVNRLFGNYIPNLRQAIRNNSMLDNFAKTAMEQYKCSIDQLELVKEERSDGCSWIFRKRETCGSSLEVKHQPSKLDNRVQLPTAAPEGLRHKLIEAIGVYQGWEEMAVAMVDECILPVLNSEWK